VISRQSSRSPFGRRWPLAAAVALLGAGGVALFAGPHDLGVRGFGLAACIASVLVIRAANRRSRPGSEAWAPGALESGVSGAPGLVTWMVAGALVPAAGVSFYYLYQDALHGYRRAAPAYIFAAVAFVCTLVWSYVASKVLQ
jgi:hypothetical protein